MTRSQEPGKNIAGPARRVRGASQLLDSANARDDVASCDDDIASVIVAYDTLDIVVISVMVHISRCLRGVLEFVTAGVVLGSLRRAYGTLRESV